LGQEARAEFFVRPHLGQRHIRIECVQLAPDGREDVARGARNIHEQIPCADPPGQSDSHVWKIDAGGRGIGEAGPNVGYDTDDRPPRFFGTHTDLGSDRVALREVGTDQGLVDDPQGGWTLRSIHRIGQTARHRLQVVESEEGRAYRLEIRNGRFVGNRSASHVDAVPESRTEGLGRGGRGGEDSRDG